MTAKPIDSITLRNFLSFGPQTPSFKTESLNVFIGPNGAGKSNFLEAIALLSQAPQDLPRALARGGGVAEWLWKGVRETPTASLELALLTPESADLRYRLEFATSGQRVQVVDEVVENREPKAGEDDVFFYYRYQNGSPALSVRGEKNRRSLRREDLIPEQSVLAQRRDPDLYPEVTWVGDLLRSAKVYRNWTFGRQNPARLPQQPDLPNDFVEEDGANLGLVLNELSFISSAQQEIKERMNRLYPDFDEVTIRVSGGTIQIFVREHGLLAPIPATRLSDGTLRFLMLLAILCSPTPPPVVCIEEPEMGLHPDAVAEVASLLVMASEKCQLFVTTHSDALVSALSSRVSSVVVVERSPDGTILERQDPERLQKWLTNYTLGDLWRMGELGGTP